MTLDRTIVEADKRLETKSERAREELAKHRWHWTLDKSNPDRVSVREYARQIGRHQATVADMVNGYAEWVEKTSVGGAPDTSQFNDFQARAKLRGETLVATEAVAKAKGIGVDSARRHHAEEVREVKATATERAERKGTTPAEEVEQVAQTRQKVRGSEAKRREERRTQHTFRYVQAEGKIAVAMRNLRFLLNDTEGVEFNAEERELLGSALGQLRALLNLLDMRIVGTADIDWDAEMAKLGDQP